MSAAAVSAELHSSSSVPAAVATDGATDSDRPTGGGERKNSEKMENGRRRRTDGIRRMIILTERDGGGDGILGPSIQLSVWIRSERDH